MAKNLGTASYYTSTEHFKVQYENENLESESWKKVLGYAKLGLESNPIPNRAQRKLQNKTESSSVRLFGMTSVSGEFHVNEILCPFRRVDVPNYLPFNQEDLYGTQQPALFLVNGGSDNVLWLWQGWWPDVGHEATDTNTTTGSDFIRWHSERRAAMKTISEYRRVKYGQRSHDMKLVWAGHEPESFVNLFPHWTVKEHIKALNEKHVGNHSLELVLDQLSKDSYSWDELQKRPFPDGVDPSRLEKYLSDDDFEKYLGISREAFNAAPHWKQLNIRKEKGLF